MQVIDSGRKIRIALVGCGRIAKNHLKAMREFPDDLELVAVCDTNAEVSQAVAKEYGVTAFDQLSQMLQESDADVVSVCTPSGSHARQVVEIAQAGKHVITEKPMATRWQDGIDMVKACDDAGVRLFVVKQNRRNATLQLLKKAVDQGRFGKIHMVSLNVFWTRPQDYYDQSPWRGTWEHDGGAFMNQASHYVDLLHWIVGPVDTIQAMTGTLARDIEAEDSGVLNIRWRSGALGSMSVTMLAYPKNFEGSITILGEKGTVRVGGMAVNEIQHWEFAEKRPEDENIADASYETTSVYGFGHPLYYANVVEVLRGQATPATDGRDGLKSLELLIAAYRSARDNVPVSLPLEL